jgi:hypothetical protein
MTYFLERAMPDQQQALQNYIDDDHPLLPSVLRRLPDVGRVPMTDSEAREIVDLIKTCWTNRHLDGMPLRITDERGEWVNVVEPRLAA